MNDASSGQRFLTQTYTGAWTIDPDWQTATTKLGTALGDLGQVPTGARIPQLDRVSQMTWPFQPQASIILLTCHLTAGAKLELKRINLEFWPRHEPTQDWPVHTYTLEHTFPCAFISLISHTICRLRTSYLTNREWDKQSLSLHGTPREHPRTSWW